MKDIPIRKIAPAQDSPHFSESFSIRAVEDLLGGKDMIQDLHRHDFFYMLVLENGDGYHEIDFIPYEVCGRCVFFMRPGQVHRLGLRKGSTGFLMSFTPDFHHPDDLSGQPLRIASNKNQCIVEEAKFGKIFGLAKAISDEYSQKQDGYRDVIKANLGILLIELIRQRQNPDVTGGEKRYMQERFEKFSILLETHIATHKQVSQYADMLSLTTYRLNAITKMALGKTASDVINDQIILEAKRYLLATTNQVNQIAYHLGYEDVSYFIRFFKKHTGLSPESFRQNFK